HGLASAQARVCAPGRGQNGNDERLPRCVVHRLHPKLVTGVWIGYDQPRTIIARGYAAILAVPLWARFMKAATSGDAPDEFPVPPTLSSAAICRSKERGDAGSPPRTLARWGADAEDRRSTGRRRRRTGDESATTNGAVFDRRL